MIGNADTLPDTMLHTVQMSETSLQIEVNPLLPPQKSGRQALTIASIALLFVNWKGNTRRKMVLGVKVGIELASKQPTN